MAMMALGMFVFALDTTPYQEMQQKAAWRHPGAPRVGLRPSHQFIGPDDETVTLSGTLYPELTGGEVSLARLKQMADQGSAWALISGTGLIYGLFVITDLEVTRTVFFEDGTARKLDFSLGLMRVDDGQVDRLGVATTWN